MIAARIARHAPLYAAVGATSPPPGDVLPWAPPDQGVGTWETWVVPATGGSRTKSVGDMTNINVDLLTNGPITGTVQITSSGNVVIIGGELRASDTTVTGGSGTANRLIYIKDPASGATVGRRVHIEGVKAIPPRDSGGTIIAPNTAGRATADFIDFDADTVIFTGQNIHAVDGSIFGGQTNGHADICQPFGGCKEMWFYNFSGIGYYQAAQVDPDTGPIERIWMENVSLEVAANLGDGGGYVYWFQQNSFTGQPVAGFANEITLINAYAKSWRTWGSMIWPQSNDATYPCVSAGSSPNRTLSYPNITGGTAGQRLPGGTRGSLSAGCCFTGGSVINEGVPTGGHFGVAANPGLSYVSPGYA